jgi:tRNA threonylcarbamoyladenosine biosynthesis protein TsaB
MIPNNVKLAETRMRSQESGAGCLPLILAIETAEKFGSVALLDGNHVLTEITLPRDRRSSQTLHPAMQTLFERSQIAPSEIDIVAVVAGPGSFTGLRVGVTAAKVFAYTTGAKVVALDTFQTVASVVPTHAGVISVGVDAQREEVVAAVLRQAACGHLETIRTPKRISVTDWWNHAEKYDDVLFTGPALERWQAKVPPHIVLAEESDWYPKASAAGILAAEQGTSATRDDVWSLLPIYSRQSAAEEKRGMH